MSLLFHEFYIGLSQPQPPAAPKPQKPPTVSVEQVEAPEIVLRGERDDDLDPELDR